MTRLGRGILALAAVLALLGLARWLLRPVARDRAPSVPALGEPAPPAARVEVPAPRAPERERRPAEPAPVRAPTPPAREPNVAELQPFHRPCAPATLCGTVLRGLEPLPGARAFLWPSAGLPSLGAGQVRASWTVSSDVAGSFAFTGLAPGEYHLRVVAPDGAQREARVALGEAEGRSKVVVFGSACVGGVVVGRTGAPAGGVTLYLTGLGADGGSLRGTELVTDASGRFEACGLTAGVYWIYPPFLDELEARSQWRLALASGERKEVRIGSTNADVRWTGAIVDARGRPVPGQQVRVEDEWGLWWASRPTDGEHFELRLPPGRVTAWLVSSESDLLARGLGPFPLELGPADLAQDLVLPGATVDLHPTWASGQWPSARSVNVLARADAGPPHPLVEARHEGWILRGLFQPGTYTFELLHGPRFVETGTSLYRFELRPGVHALELDVTIANP